GFMCCHFSGDKMKNPGNWILGTPSDRGMGIVVEYANARGKPQWHDSGKSDWNYLLFADTKPPPSLTKCYPWRLEKSTEAKAGSTSGRSTGNLSIKASQSKSSRDVAIGSLL